MRFDDDDDRIIGIVQVALLFAMVITVLVVGVCGSETR
jgi:hypothetical protein